MQEGEANKNEGNAEKINHFIAFCARYPRELWAHCNPIAVQWYLQQIALCNVCNYIDT